jgi:hypothetical protein
VLGFFIRSWFLWLDVMVTRGRNLQKLGCFDEKKKKKGSGGGT